MKLVLFSDTHGCHREVVSGAENYLYVPDGDAVIHCGDFSAHGTLYDILSFNNFLGSLKHKVKVVGAGNHDVFVQSELGMAKIHMSNAKLVVHEPFMLSDKKCFFTSYLPYYNKWAFEVADDKARGKLFAQIPDDTEILFSHCPPYGILDVIDSGENIGDHELLKRVRDLKHLKYHIFGHAHASHGITDIRGVQYINCSIMDDRYDVVNQPMIVDIK